jgi:Tol biopolymer transport system component
MPDSRNLVVASTTEPDTFRTHLHRVDTQTGTIGPLVRTTGIEAAPAVSRDGRRIAYTAMDIDIDIVELPVDGSPPRPVIATSRFERSPGWHPSVREFAYVTDRRGTEEIWIHTMLPSRDRPVVVQSNFPDGQARFLNAPAFSPEGERLAFVRSGGAQPNSQGVEIWVAGVAGGALAKLTNVQGGNQWAPTWSPDGHWIAYFESTTKRLMRARVGAAAAPETVITCPPAGECLPEWSPKGDWIAVKTGAGGTILVTPDGSQSRVLRPVSYQAIAWARDSASLFGLIQQDGRLRLYSMDIATGKERLLNTFGPELALDAMYSSGIRVSLSPDGKGLLAGRRSLSADLWMVENFDRVSTPWTRLRDLPQNLFGAFR